MVQCRQWTVVVYMYLNVCESVYECGRVASHEAGGRVHETLHVSGPLNEEYNPMLKSGQDLSVHVFIKTI